ncbi:MAG: hypothetical protein R3C56_03975 [Pirellulaceae bacterium]
MLLLPVIPHVIASYELLKQLGGGGMGAVYLARHKKLDKQVAIKLLPAQPAGYTRICSRVQREMRAAGQLNTNHCAFYRRGGRTGFTFWLWTYPMVSTSARPLRSVPQLSIADACETRFVKPPCGYAMKDRASRHQAIELDARRGGACEDFGFQFGMKSACGMRARPRSRRLDN